VEELLADQEVVHHLCQGVHWAHSIQGNRDTAQEEVHLGEDNQDTVHLVLDRKDLGHKVILHKVSVQARGHKGNHVVHMVALLGQEEDHALCTCQVVVPCWVVQGWDHSQVQERVQNCSLLQGHFLQMHHWRVGVALINFLL